MSFEYSATSVFTITSVKVMGCPFPLETISRLTVTIHTKLWGKHPLPGQMSCMLTVLGIVMYM